MQDRHLRCSRRKFLASAAALTIAGGMDGRADQQAAVPPTAIRTRPPKPSKAGRRPIAVLRQGFKDEWYHSVKPEVFVHEDFPTRLW